MIPKEDIDKIFDASKIEEVVADYVTLKKRGVNMIGLCPFHDEKTPSFYVSPAKGIYKCFGCGKGGHAVNFIMEKESMAYPDALRLLAKKYNIEITEEERTPEQLQLNNDRESLFVALSFAQKQFTDNLYNTEEGKSIGLSYFKERGFREDIIHKFQLGYSINNRASFTDTALAQGYKKEYLVKAGLTIEYNAHPNPPEGREPVQQEGIVSESSSPLGRQGGAFDRFWGRVMFPIHNATGRVIAFGGRTLRNDKKTAKYINSPETEVYRKSDVLYGMYFAKKEMINQDNCFLVEGYTDVISMHQAGIENVVASSGTSLTTGQIKQIRRFTKNITILYDGDSAGIKASFRGIDLILEEGLNVKVLLFPDGEDPDSYSKRLSSEELKTFIKKNTKDFVEFKTKITISEAGNDPIKRVTAIDEIVDTLSILPAMKSEQYITICSQLLNIDEKTLINSVNKKRRDKLNKKGVENSQIDIEEPNLKQQGFQPSIDEIIEFINIAEPQERKIIELLINHGNKKIMVDSDEKDEKGRNIEIETTVANLLVAEMQADEENLKLENPLYKEIYNEFVKHLENDMVPDVNYFRDHQNKEIRDLTVDLISTPYEISRWDTKGIYINKEEDDLKKTAQKSVYTLACKRIEIMINDIKKQMIASTEEEEIIRLQQMSYHLNESKKHINSFLGRIITK